MNKENLRFVQCEILNVLNKCHCLRKLMYVIGKGLFGEHALFLDHKGIGSAFFVN